MSDTKVIYVDHSTLSTFATCEEKGRLAYVEHLRPLETGKPLIFGSAFHAAVASIYSGGSRESAHTAFLDEVRRAGPDTLPLSADSTEKRSVERGLYLIDAYIEKWAAQDVNWEDVLRPDTAEPYVEMGFAVFLMNWQSTPVMYVGKVDRIRRNRVDGQLYNWETKTTGSAVSYYVQQTRPNHQITGYKWACQEFLKLNIAGTILDVIHVSDRKIGGKFVNGIDIEKDFARVETRRSTTDVEEFLFDVRALATRYLALQDAGERRWSRNAPAACYMYGGCHFRDLCNSNLNPQIMANKYRKEVWQPWIIQDQEPTKSPVTL